MNKQQKYLNKVVEQLVSETNIDDKIVSPPFLHSFFPLPLSLLPPIPNILPFPPPTSFSSFVTKVYGLTEEEVKYVWKQYRYIINSRI